MMLALSFISFYISEFESMPGTSFSMSSARNSRISACGPTRLRLAIRQSASLRQGATIELDINNIGKKLQGIPEQCF